MPAIQPKKEAREGYQWVVFIFIKQVGKEFIYLELDDDCPNDGATPAEGRRISFKNKFGKGHAGAMFLIETAIDGTSIKFFKDGQPVDGYWKRHVDVLNWQAEQRVEEDKNKMAKMATEDHIRIACKPLKEAYSRLPSYTQDRAIFLARIMAEITRNIS